RRGPRRAHPRREPHRRGGPRRRRALRRRAAGGADVIHHAGLLAKWAEGHWNGVLIEGDSGSGKSDLALRALDEGWALVADDRTLLWACEGRLYGRAPDPIAGLIEARGLGV